MRRVNASTKVALAVALLTLSASMIPGRALHAQSATAASTAPTLAPGEYYVVCTSDPSGPVIYFSEVFVGKADPPGHSRFASFQLISNYFRAFLQQKYTFKSYPECQGGPSESPVQAAKQQLEDKYKKANQQIVETGWKNAS